jgi:putative DNA primase/helicase
VKNGILLPGSRELLAPSPAWFTITTLDTSYAPDATCPLWEKFLLDLWPHDTQSRDTLQEIFGYLLTCDMSQEKIFALFGPPRSGKGTIMSTLRRLLGDDSTASMTLASLTEGFERQQLIGKTLAIIADTRLGRRTDVAKLLEILLTISGRDNPSIPRKYRDAYEGPLYVRFFIASNEALRFLDSTGAVVNRFIILKTKKNFLGHEDLSLKAKLLSELAGILNWALDGWDRLQERSYFVQPESAMDEVELLANSSNPLTRFVDDECVLDEKPDVWTAKEELHRSYLRWCEDQKIGKPLGSDNFFRKLKDAYPTLRDYRPRTRQRPKARPRFLMGIRLMTEQQKAERLATEEKPDAA